MCLDLPGSKVVVGAGPDLVRLRRQFPEAHFVGGQDDTQLPALCSAADVFVFSSLIDTFSLVMLEAMACDTQVEAFAERDADGGGARLGAGRSAET